MDYQWYPGHMTKAIRQMREDIKLVDLVIELLDARIPLSSRNPDIDNLGQNKARLFILNKSDLADESQNNLWDKYFKDKDSDKCYKELVHIKICIYKSNGNFWKSKKCIISCRT